jgi:methyl-accepting chemotaxis protein
MPLSPSEERAASVSRKTAEFLREMTIMFKLDNQTLQLVLIALVALAMVTQAIVLLAAYLAMRKAARSADEKIEEFRASILPLVDKTRDLLTRLAPKIEATAEDVAALTHSLRLQTTDVQYAANEIVTRVRSQASRIDTLLTNVLDAIERAGGFMADAVSKPMRQLSAILASAKAAVESLRNYEPAPRSNADRVSGDNDMFV